MAKNKNVLIGLIFMLLFMAGCIFGCENKDSSNSEFPLDELGLPQINVVNINGQNKEFSYKLGENSQKKDKVELDIKIKDELKISLAQGLPIHVWVYDDKILGIQLLSKRKILPNKNKNYDKEGSSPYIQEFTFKITDKDNLKTINFKKVNANLVLNEDGSLKKDINYVNLESLFELELVFQ